MLRRCCQHAPGKVIGLGQLVLAFKVRDFRQGVGQ
jgi:hypothetical protein